MASQQRRVRVKISKKQSVDDNGHVLKKPAGAGASLARRLIDPGPVRLADASPNLAEPSPSLAEPLPNPTEALPNLADPSARLADASPIQAEAAQLVPAHPGRGDVENPLDAPVPAQRPAAAPEKGKTKVQQLTAQRTELVRAGKTVPSLQARIRDLEQQLAATKAQMQSNFEKYQANAREWEKDEGAMKKRIEEALAAQQECELTLREAQAELRILRASRPDPQASPWSANMSATQFQELKQELCDAVADAVCECFPDESSAR